jgi:histidyl-tRNA synthetase
MATTTLFNSSDEAITNQSLIVLSHDIKDGKHKDLFEEHDSLIKTGDKKALEDLKARFQRFTPSGTFLSRRDASNLIYYNQFLMFSIHAERQQSDKYLSTLLKTLTRSFAIAAA